MPAHWTLTIETCVPNASLVLACEEKVKAERSFYSERSQECDLFVPLQEILTEIPKGESLSEIIIGTGPGSYNGARVGIAAAQAVAQVHGCPVAGICSFEGTKEAAQGEIWAIGDARRDSFFVLPLVGGIVQGLPVLLEKEEFLEKVASFSGTMVTFESPDRLPAGLSCVETSSTARGILQAWGRRSVAEKEALFKIPVEAFYLRPPHITKAKPKKK